MFAAARQVSCATVRTLYAGSSSPPSSGDALPPPPPPPPTLPDALAAGSQRWAWRLGASSLTALPAASFDRVVVAHALTMVETGGFGSHGHAALLREAARLLRPGGALVVLEGDHHDSVALREALALAVAAETVAATKQQQRGRRVTPTPTPTPTRRG